MSRFLLAVWSLESHVNPNLAVGTALRERGHEVAFYAGPKAARELEEREFRVFPFQKVSEEMASAQFALLLEDQGNARKLTQAFSDVLLSQLVPQVEDLADIIDTWRPDVLVTDMAMVAPYAILHEWKKIPVAVLSHVGYCMVPGPEGPIPGRAMPPRTSFAARLQAALVHRVADWITRGVPKEIDRVRKHYGLDPTGMRVTQLHARVNALLIPSIAELDYNRSGLPSTVRYVGPCLWPRSSTAAQSVASKPAIAVEEGGYYRKHPFLLNVAIRALRGAEWEVTLVPGRERNWKELESLDTNMRFASASEAADLVITTGNTESVLRALSRGTPVIVVPSLLDQSEMALRVKLYGAGVSLPESECTPENLARTARAVLAENRFRQKAAEAAHLLSGDLGPERAARELEGLIARSR